MKKWGLKINPLKTVAMVFSKNKSVSKKATNIKIDNKVIETKSETTFLGVTLDNQLNWSKHIQQLIAKCNPLLNMLAHINGKGWGADLKTSLLFYKSYIRAKLDYGSIVYQSAPESSLKKIRSSTKQGFENHHPSQMWNI